MNILQRFVRPIPAEDRRRLVAEITPQASPGFDFFLLVILSCSIATLGLLTDSPAVIIGAMLVAPLMSPIIGIGLSSITGDTLLLRNALSALLRGAFTAVLLAALITLVNRFLPLLSLQSLSSEILARTRPSPIDLVIALAGGLAAAYAMTNPNLSAALPGVAIATALMPPLCTVGIGLALGRLDVTGGALLLFVTNAVTIAFAAALVFFIRGFGMRLREAESRLPRSLLLSASLTLILFFPLNYYGVKFFREASENRTVHTIVEEEVGRMNGSEVVELNLNRAVGSPLDMVITIQTAKPLDYGQVIRLQETIVNRLQQPVSLRINQIFAEQLDPLIPPTLTFTPTITNTVTPGPSLTPTPIPTYTPTPTATATASPSPTFTPTNTPTPFQLKVINTALPRLRIFQYPGGPEIGILRTGQELTVLYRTQIHLGLVWVEVQDAEGRIGWVPQVYLGGEE